MSLCYLLCLCKYTDFSLKQTNEFICLSRQTHLNYTDYPIPEKRLSHFRKMIICFNTKSALKNRTVHE